jgi:hypothetical protein
MADNKYVELTTGLTEAGGDWTIDSGVATKLAKSGGEYNPYRLVDLEGLNATLIENKGVPVLAEGKAATVSVTVTLLNEKKEAILASSKTIKVTVTNDVEVFDNYKIYMTSEDVYTAKGLPAKDIDTVYIGKANKDGDDWAAGYEPSVQEFAFRITGSVAGSTTEYDVADENFILEDTEKLIDEDGMLRIDQ